MTNLQPHASLPMHLLQMLSSGGIRSTSELARRLNVSEALVTMMAEDLTRRGYLRALSGGDCDSGCGGCGLAASCKLPGEGNQLPLLTLTAKGKSASATV